MKGKREIPAPTFDDGAGRNREQHILTDLLEDNHRTLKMPVFSIDLGADILTETRPPNFSFGNMYRPIIQMQTDFLFRPIQKQIERLKFDFYHIYTAAILFDVCLDVDSYMRYSLHA